MGAHHSFTTPCFMPETSWRPATKNRTISGTVAVTTPVMISHMSLKNEELLWIEGRLLAPDHGFAPTVGIFEPGPRFAVQETVTGLRLVKHFGPGEMSRQVPLLEAEPR